MINKKGFTIIELLVVIAILGILVLISIPNFADKVDAAKETKMKNDIRTTETVLASKILEDDDFLLSKPREQVSGKTILMSSKDKVIRGSIKGDLYNVSGLTDSKLQGTFLSTEKGKVYYHDEALSSEEEQEDHGYEIQAESAERFKLLDFKMPSGKYTHKDKITGFIEVEGFVTGNYPYNIKMTDKHGNPSIIISGVMNVREGENTVTPFEYKFNGEEELGFYEVYFYLGDWEYEVYKNEAFEILSSEWRFYHNRNDIGAGRSREIGLGYIEPENYIRNEDTKAFSLKINDDRYTSAMSVSERKSYGSYEARMKMPEQAGLLSGFFLYGEPNGSVQEIDMEMMKFPEGDKERWELWMTIHSPNHPDYVYAAYLEDYDPNIEYSEDGDDYAEPGVIYQKKINLTEFLGESPENNFNNYRINYYDDYVSFEVNGIEVGRWNNKLGEHELELLTSTFWAHWLKRYQYDTTWEESLEVEWIRDKYDK